MHWIRLARALAWPSAGRRSAASSVMIAITHSSSIRLIAEAPTLDRVTLIPCPLGPASPVPDEIPQEFDAPTPQCACFSHELRQYHSDHLAALAIACTICW